MLFRKKWYVTLFTIVLVVILTGCGGNVNTDETSNSETSLSSGEDIYKKSCATCHGGDLTGVSGPPLVNVEDRYSKDDITDIINDGKGQMFPVNLPADEVEILVDWLVETQ